MAYLVMALALAAQSAALSSIPPAPVFSDDTKPSFRAHASPTCSGWRSAGDAKDDDGRLRNQVYKQWILGYISGFNVIGPDQTGNLLGTASRDEFYTALDGYCSRNPTASVVDAMRPIAEAVIRRRGVPAVSPSSLQATRRATINAPSSCKDWAAGKSSAILRLAYVVTLQGYITAYNQWGPDPVGDAIGADDQSVIEEATNNWCGEHPSGLLIGAVMPLIDRVAAERAGGRGAPAGMRATDQFTQDLPSKR